MASALIDRVVMMRLVETRLAQAGLTVAHRRQPDPQAPVYARVLAPRLRREARVRAGADQPDLATFELSVQVVVGPQLKSAYALDAAVMAVIANLHEQTLRDEATSHQVDFQTVDESDEANEDTERTIEAVRLTFRGTVMRLAGASLEDGPLQTA